MIEAPIDAARRIKNTMDRSRRSGVYLVFWGKKDGYVVYSSGDPALVVYEAPNNLWRWVGTFQKDVSVDQLAEDIDYWYQSTLAGVAQ